MSHNCKGKKMEQQEIDEEDWNGKTVRVDDIVMVYGNVDKGSDYVEIDVSSVER